MKESTLITSHDFILATGHLNRDEIFTQDLGVSISNMSSESVCGAFFPPVLLKGMGPPERNLFK
jgi:hypothetical protein